jgi:hypothetical protein
MQKTRNAKNQQKMLMLSALLFKKLEKGIMFVHESVLSVENVKINDYVNSVYSIYSKNNDLILLLINICLQKF